LKSKINDLYIKRGSDEDSFERICMNRASDLGARVVYNSKLVKFNWDKQNSVKNVIVEHNGKKSEIKPTFIIGADGVNSNVLKLSGLSDSEKIFGEFYGYGIYGKDFNLPADTTHVFFNRTIAPGGYLFTAKSKKNDCVLGIGIDPILAKENPKESFNSAISNKSISEVIENAVIKNNFIGLGRFGFLKKRAIGNILLVGDAGRFGDPFLCYGVRQAILSGYTATKVCKSYLDSTSQVEPCKEYELKTKSLIDENKLGLLFRKTYRKFTNDDIDIIFKILSEALNDGLDLDDFYKRENLLLIKHILHNMKGSTKICAKVLPNLVEYLLKIHHF